jgi:tRNA-2-methylthio-N6-dimethylallyladenosine synthase
MHETLCRAGFEPVDDAESANVIVFNTCSVREKAEQKLRSELGRYKARKKTESDLVLAVAGCVASQEGSALLKAVPHLDVVIGPDNIAELPGLLRDAQRGGPPTARTEFDHVAPNFLAFHGARADVSSFVTTMKGCDERCSFCIVPYTRGAERYRPAAEILEEVATLVARGAKEITLLGQTVDSYRDENLPPPDTADPDESQFPHLLRMIAHRVPTLKRLRYTSPHPRHLTPSLIRAHAELPLLVPHVHMPVQSGSDRVLKRMIRRYTRAEYIARVSKLKAARPGLTLSTDIIVGFPGETQEDFEATLSLVREVGFVSLFAFAYSERPFTPALKLKDDVSEEEKSKRLQALLALAESQTAAHLATLMGTRQRVLIEGPSKQNPTSFQGRTERNEIVHLALDKDVDPTGNEVDVEVIEVFRHSLRGEAISDLSHLPKRSATTKNARRALPLLA